ncbi:MAG: fibronectin type III domain-containing protein [Saprospiraceae bacterium]
MNQSLLRALALTSSCVFFALTLVAQTPTTDTLDQADILVLGEYADGVVRLRWAPRDAASWMLANYYGYTIERLDVKAEIGTPIKVLAKGMKPLGLPAWKDLAARNPNDSMLLIGAEMLHGVMMKNLVRGGPDANAATQFEELYNMMLFSADMSWENAKALALAFEDKTAKVDGDYIYRVRLSEQPEGQGVEAGVVGVLAEAKPFKPRIAKIGESETIVSIHLNRKYHAGHYTAFSIERSPKGMDRWVRLNRQPFVHGVDAKSGEKSENIVYSDTLAELYVPFRYRVVGHTPFGKTSEPSEVVVGMARDRTPPPAPRKLTAETTPGPTVELRWEMPETGLGDLAGFWVSRQQESYGEISQLNKVMLPANTRSYVDKTPLADGQNYYMVAAVDTAGNGIPSLTTYAMFVDSIPPVPPTGLTGTVDTNGIVELKWDASEDQGVVGYQLFYAHQEDHVFTLRNGQNIEENSFTDTVVVRALKRDMFYYVIAIDATSNYSLPSDTFRLVKPDVVAPVPPVLRKLNKEDGIIVAEFVASTSDDVVRHEWLRREAKGASDWTVLRSWGKGDATGYLRDSTALAGVRYSYALRATDESGLVSDIAFALEAEGALNRLGVVDQVTASEGEDESGVVLTWVSAYPEASVCVYRAIDGGPYDMIKRLPALDGTWTDRSAKPNKRYEYMLQLQAKKQLPGEMSEPAAIVFSQR